LAVKPTAISGWNWKFERELADEHPCLPARDVGHHAKTLENQAFSPVFETGEPLRF